MLKKMWKCDQRKWNKTWTGMYRTEREDGGNTAGKEGLVLQRKSFNTRLNRFGLIQRQWDFEKGCNMLRICMKVFTLASWKGRWETGGWKITWKDSAFIHAYVLGIISGCFPKILVDVHGVREGLTLGESGEKKKKKKSHSETLSLFT